MLYLGMDLIAHILGELSGLLPFVSLVLIYIL